MRDNIENKILSRIKKDREGFAIFYRKFYCLWKYRSSKKALQRLTNAGQLERIATGIYVRPKKDSIIGIITPGIEEIAKAIAKRDRARIVPTGIFALNKLGLSTQVPLNIIYLTDGAARKIKIGKIQLHLKDDT